MVNKATLIHFKDENANVPVRYDAYVSVSDAEVVIKIPEMGDSSISVSRLSENADVVGKHPHDWIWLLVQRCDRVKFVTTDKDGVFLSRRRDLGMFDFELSLHGTRYYLLTDLADPETTSERMTVTSAKVIIAPAECGTDQLPYMTAHGIHFGNGDSTTYSIPWKFPMNEDTRALIYANLGVPLHYSTNVISRLKTDIPSGDNPYALVHRKIGAFEYLESQHRRLLLHFHSDPDQLLIPAVIDRIKGAQYLPEEVRKTFLISFMENVLRNKNHATYGCIRYYWNLHQLSDVWYRLINNI